MRVYVVYRKGVLRTDDELKQEFYTIAPVRIGNDVVTINEQSRVWHLPLRALVSISEAS